MRQERPEASGPASDRTIEPSELEVKLAAALAGDDDLRRRLEAELMGSATGRRAIADAVAAGPPLHGPEARPAVPIEIGRNVAGESLHRWRTSDRRALVIIGDSIANRFSKPLRMLLRDRLPGGMSFGYAGLAGHDFAGWVADGPWNEVGSTTANLGLPATAAAARRSPGGTEMVLTWTRPPGWTVDEAQLHWVDDAATGPEFSYRVDDGPWVEVRCDAPTSPVLQRTPLGPVHGEVVIRAASGDAMAAASPVFLGLDARDASAANVVHALTSPGGRIAGRPGDDRDACLAPGRLDAALRHLEHLRPSLILWETINDARALDLDRFDRSVDAVAKAFPDAEHVAAAVYEVADDTMIATEQDDLHRHVLDHFAAVVDFRARWGPPAVAQAAGLLAPDGVHPTRPGMDDLAAAIAGLLAIAR